VVAATSVAPDLPSQRRAWFSLFVLVLATLFSFVDRQVLALLTVPVSLSLHLQDSQIGVIQGLGSAVFAMIATYPLGLLADRLDRRLVLVGSILVWAAGTAACGLASGFASLFIAVIAISAGEAGLPSLSYAAIPDIFEGRLRVTANQVFYVAMILSSAAGMVLGAGASAALVSLQSYLPAALHGTESWRGVFFLVALPAPLLMLLTAFTRLNRRGTPPQRVFEDKRAHSANQDSEALIPYLRRHGAAVAIVLAALWAYGLPFGALLTWVPAALARLFGSSPAASGTGLGAGLAIGCTLGVGLAALLMRHVTRRLGSRAPFRISYWALLASLPTALLLACVTSAWQAYLVIGLQMMTGTLIGSLLPGILQGLAPPGLRGRVVALYQVFSIITTGVGVSLVAPLSDLIPGNPRGLLIGMAVLAAVSWVIGALLLKMAEPSYRRMSEAFDESVESARSVGCRN
jgi:MFS family permease